MWQRTCTIEGCDLPRPYKLYCDGHYRRWKRTGDPGPAQLRRRNQGDGSCAFEGCDKPVRSAGLCGGHYLQKWSGRPLQALREQPDTTAIGADGKKMCSRCSTRRDVSEFYKNNRIRGGLSPHCKRCKRSEALMRSYGINIEQYDALLASQGGVCAICGEVNRNGRNLYVDHDHGCCPGAKACGSCVRGILCDPCNRAIGLMKDDQQRLERASAYLRKSVERGGAK